MRYKMSKSKSRSTYRKTSDRIHVKNLVAALDQRGGYRL